MDMQFMDEKAIGHNKLSVNRQILNDGNGQYISFLCWVQGPYA